MASTVGEAMRRRMDEHEYEFLVADRIRHQLGNDGCFGFRLGRLSMYAFGQYRLIDCASRVVAKVTERSVIGNEAQTREVDTTKARSRAEDALVFPFACRRLPAREICLLGEVRLGRKERTQRVWSLLQYCGILQHCRECRISLKSTFAV
jgi:hypothetical protein